MTDKKPREFWIEHKLFVDEWIYEAFTSKESCPNKDLIPIHVVEISALLEAQAEIARLKTAYEDLKNTDWNKHDTANAKLREALDIAFAQLDHFCDGMYRDWNVDGQANSTIRRMEEVVEAFYKKHPEMKEIE